MEAVLKVRVQGIAMPWKEIVRGCLVSIMFGILCLCVQNCTQSSRVQAVPVCGAAMYRTASAAKQTDLLKICGNAKQSAADMRRRLTDFSADLSGTVTVVPVRNIREENLSVKSGAEFLWSVPSDTVSVPGLDAAGGCEIRVPENAADMPAVPPVVPWRDPSGTERTEPEIAENPSGTGVTDLPDGTVAPGETEISDEPAVPEEIAGFILDDEGYITGYTERVCIRDDLLLIPEDEGCVGIRAGAFHGLDENVMEVYIPATIQSIEPGAFDVFPYLMFIEVSGENPYYYSLDGILYSVSGEEVFCPAGRQIE